MIFAFTTSGWADFEYWMDQDAALVLKIRALLADIRRTPFTGIGKPEPLKFEFKGWWSRRITGEHRLVYKVEGTKGVDQKCTILQCRFHYD